MNVSESLLLFVLFEGDLRSLHFLSLFLHFSFFLSILSPSSAVLSPASTTFCDAHLLKFFREALLLSSSSSISSRSRQILFSVPIKPEAAVHAVKVSRELALSRESIQEEKERISGGVKEREKKNKKTETGEGMEGKKRLRGENFLSFSRESTPAAIMDAWTEYKTTRADQFSANTWLEQSRLSMKNKEIGEVERLLEKVRQPLLFSTVVVFHRRVSRYLLPSSDCLCI